MTVRQSNDKDNRKTLEALCCAYTKLSAVGLLLVLLSPRGSESPYPEKEHGHTCAVTKAKDEFWIAEASRHKSGDPLSKLSDLFSDEFGFWPVVTAIFVVPPLESLRRSHTTVMAESPPWLN